VECVVWECPKGLVNVKDMLEQNQFDDKRWQENNKKTWKWTRNDKLLMMNNKCLQMACQNTKDVRTLDKIFIFIFGQREVPKGTKGTRYDIKDHSGVQK
jgi:hypothetical protein